MTTLHRHNPSLRQKLQVYISLNNPQSLLEELNKLSVTEFRTAGYLLSEELLPQLSSEQFWDFFVQVVPTNSRAYLGTFLKAAVILYKKKELLLDENKLNSFALQCTAIDTRKTLLALLPLFQSDNEVETLLRTFSFYNVKKAFPYLHHAATPAAYYVLFKLLKTADLQTDFLRLNVINLMKKGDQLSFNMASILCQYFDLKNIPGQFSLHIHPYELGRLEQGFSTFKKILSQ